MTDNLDPSRDMTTMVVEMEPGWVYVKVGEAKPDPSRTELLLRRTIEEWFAKRPTFVITKATAITNHGEMLGIHVWYDLAQSQSKPVRAEDPTEFGIDVHGQIAARHSKEYIEAVITDALK